MANKDKPTKQLNMAIPADLYDWCVEEARKDRRSLANWIRLMLHQIREKVNCK